MAAPEDLKFAKSHEWVRLEGDTVYIGISDHAQEALGDIVYVELPDEDTELSKGDEATNIESVKAASAIYAPVSGTIVKVNGDLEDEPELVNQKPYEAFLFAMKVKDTSELDSLMSYKEYQNFLESEEE